MQIPINIYVYILKMHHLESTKPCPFYLKLSNFLVPFQFVRISTFIIPNILRMSLVDWHIQAD